jgi:hypothetical protein
MGEGGLDVLAAAVMHTLLCISVEFVGLVLSLADVMPVLFDNAFVDSLHGMEVMGHALRDCRTVH